MYSIERSSRARYNVPRHGSDYLSRCGRGESSSCRAARCAAPVRGRRGRWRQLGQRLGASSGPGAGNGLGQGLGRTEQHTSTVRRAPPPGAELRLPPSASRQSQVSFES
eukprot:scaffold75901_cov63-Phaeocystis_antarctica.AAC.2